MRFTHRPGLDGLRAAGALLVVVFHAGLPWFRNGYVGVDVFFVLSGFLITSLLVRQRLRRGRIALLGFYARRARRLFPAALSVLLLTAFAYQLLASPLAVAENRMGFVSAALYVSNWYFLGKSQDYFAAEESPSPVLHYWSLSVEEQFYLLWPLLLMALLSVRAIRRRTAGVWVLSALALLALALSAWASMNTEMLWYFGTLGRAYQLLVGAALAMLVLLWQRRGINRERLLVRWTGRTLAAAGLVALFVVASDLGPLASWWVGLAGVGATAAIIIGLELSARGPAGRLLASRPARALGRWSYSIYLWHWPIIVLGDEAGLLPAQWQLRVPLVTAASIGLAALWWVVLEGPLSRVPLRERRPQAIAVASGIAATIGSAVLAWNLLQVPASTEQVVAQIAMQDAAVFEPVGTSTVRLYERDDGFTTVINGKRADLPTLLVIGDSHAALWQRGLIEAADERNLRVIQVISYACPWMDVQTVEWTGEASRPCQDSLRAPALAAAAKYQPDVTIFFSRAALVRNLVVDGQQFAPGSPGWGKGLASGGRDFLDQIRADAGRLVFVPTWPETAGDTPDCLASGNSAADCAAPATGRAGMTEQEQVLRMLAADYKGRVVTLDDLVCPRGVCPAVVDGSMTYRDTHHLTHEYAAMLTPALIARADKGYDLLLK